MCVCVCVCVCVCHCVTVCKTFQVLLKNHLIKPKDSPDQAERESLVFYHKMDGDYYRYMAEVASEDGKKGQIFCGWKLKLWENPVSARVYNKREKRVSIAQYCMYSMCEESRVLGMQLCYTRVSYGEGVLELPPPPPDNLYSLYA